MLTDSIDSKVSLSAGITRTSGDLKSCTGSGDSGRETELQLPPELGKAVFGFWFKQHPPANIRSAIVATGAPGPLLRSYSSADLDEFVRPVSQERFDARSED